MEAILYTQYGIMPEFSPDQRVLLYTPDYVPTLISIVPYQIQVRSLEGIWMTVSLTAPSEAPILSVGTHIQIMFDEQRFFGHIL